MESRVVDNRVCNGSKPSDAAVAMAVGSEEGVGNGEDYADTKSLLPVAGVKGGMGGRRQRSLRRKVQWNDRNGNKLVEVLEFDPSDSSDSDEENADSCFCAIM